MAFRLLYKRQPESQWRHESTTGVNTERKILKKEENLHFPRCILSIGNLPSEAERGYNCLIHTASYARSL